jgi:UDP-3-O-[3-hydroxymyristoyl] glucosamine N-acyltransferase
MGHNPRAEGSVGGPLRLDEIAALVGGIVHGDGALVIHGVETLDRAGPTDLSFLTNPRYRRAAEASRAGAILARADAGLSGRTWLGSADPHFALARILDAFHPRPAWIPGVSERASIATTARLGREVTIGPFAVIEDAAELGDRSVVAAGAVVGAGCRIGAETVILPRAVLYPGTLVGQRCLIHAGVVLGADGFGFATAGGQHHKVPQVGCVVVEDDVEIGANTTIDRAMLGETVVGEGTKIDDLVMVAHGVRLGRGCLIAAQSGIAGSSRLGDRVTLAGQVGIIGHIEIASGTVVASKAAVYSDVEQAGLIGGIPATEHLRWKRSQALVARLPEIWAELRDLRRRVSELEAERAP